MSLAMSRPFKHPTTGVYYLRKRVPHDLVPVVGRREEKISLNTKNPVEAKRLHLAALADLEARWANLRAGPVTLSEREAHEIAFELYDRWIEMHRDEPSAQTRWRTDLFEKLWFPPTAADIAHPLDEPDWNGVKRAEMEALAFEGADLLLQRRGIRVDDVGRMKLARAVAAVLQQASLVLSRQARGEIGETFSRPVSDGNKTTVAPANARVRLSFEDAIKLWIAEKRPRERTIYEWRRTLAELASFIGHSDAHRLSVDDLLRWKNALLEAKRSTKTIRDAKIAPVRAVFQCAVNNRRLPENPAEKITISVKVSATEARRDFTDAEAALVLKAALNETDPVLRWVPWLCAYSGARVSEVCQLRREDIHQHDGVWCMRFAAEAGPLKNANSERAVPLHPALIESGFLAFVKAVKNGPIFADLPPDKFGKRGGNGTKVLGRFVRSLGLKDARLAPNHSWRHRFKTMGRRYDMRLDIVDAMTGHAPKTVGDAYGMFPMEAMLREIEKIPTLNLDRAS